MTKKRGEIICTYVYGVFVYTHIYIYSQLGWLWTNWSCISLMIFLKVWTTYNMLYVSLVSYFHVRRNYCWRMDGLMMFAKMICLMSLLCVLETRWKNIIFMYVIDCVSIELNEPWFNFIQYNFPCFFFYNPIICLI